MNPAVGQQLLATFTVVYTLMRIYYHKIWETKPAFCTQVELKSVVNCLATSNPALKNVTVKEEDTFIQVWSPLAIGKMVFVIHVLVLT